MTFKDNFSKQSGTYLKYRPTYPPELFEYLAAVAPDRILAWDCGTGNGQAAIGLARYFDQVLATDPSIQQIEKASPHPNIVYKVGKAEKCELSDHSADLITVAQALHWFNFDLFYAEAKRVLKKNGIMAAWAYGLPIIEPEIDRLIRYFHDEVLGDLWQPENRLIEKEYTTIPFPFEPVAMPDFYMEKQFSPDELVGLVRSWSATQRYMDQKGKDPVPELEQQLLQYWKNPVTRKTAKWKLILKLGRYHI
jgi:ubiquinone/menaquinone biosynthesis C-methylase UbiE